jgi:hypothetical protein
MLAPTQRPHVEARLDQSHQKRSDRRAHPNYRQSQALVLGVSRSTLYRMMHRYPRCTRTSLKRMWRMPDDSALTALFASGEIYEYERCPTYLHRWRMCGGSTRHGHGAQFTFTISSVTTGRSTPTTIRSASSASDSKGISGNRARAWIRGALSPEMHRVLATLGGEQLGIGQPVYRGIWSENYGCRHDRAGQCSHSDFVHSGDVHHSAALELPLEGIIRPYAHVVRLRRWSG